MEAVQITPDAPKSDLLSAAPVELQDKDIDPELWEALETIQPNAKTIQSEIAFLNEYIERFQFKQDTVRLNTLKAYQDRQQQS